jgi:hypothetical protein
MIRRPIWMPGRFATSTSSATLGDRAAAPLTGDSLVHADMRADNLVLRADGTTITIVDWPWASLGATWFDRLMLLVNVRCDDGQLSTDIDADPDDITAVLAGVAGYIVDAARQPPPPGLPTVRAFQAAQGQLVNRRRRPHQAWHAAPEARPRPGAFS